MFYLPVHNHRPRLAQDGRARTLAPRDFESIQAGSAISLFTFLVIYVFALLGLLAWTTTMICIFRSRRRKNERKVEGDILGLVLVTGELLWLSNAVLYAAYFGVAATNEVMPITCPTLINSEEKE